MKLNNNIKRFILQVNLENFLCCRHLFCIDHLLLKCFPILSYCIVPFMFFNPHYVIENVCWGMKRKNWAGKKQTEREKNKAQILFSLFFPTWNKQVCSIFAEKEKMLQGPFLKYIPRASGNIILTKSLKFKESIVWNNAAKMIRIALKIRWIARLHELRMNFCVVVN